MKYIIPVICMLAFVCDTWAAVKIKNSTAQRYEEQIVYTKGEEVGADEAADIETLENDIRILDEEIAKCQKQKKGWIAATVIGAAGVVATGTAAAVQGVKISEKKNEYTTQKNLVSEKDKELYSLQQQQKKEKQQ